MPVFHAESPLTCVAVGSGEALAHLDTLNLTSRQPRAHADDAGLANRPGVSELGLRSSREPLRQMDICPAAAD